MVLYWVVYKGFFDFVKLLVCMDVDVYRADKEGCIALYWVVIKGKSEVVYLIVCVGGLNVMMVVDVDGNMVEVFVFEKGYYFLVNFFVKE